MSLWTIEPYMHAGEAREFPDKLARTIKRRDANCDEGFVTFDKEGAPFDASPLWAYGAMLTIRKDGAPWFTGRRQLLGRAGTPADERHSYTLADPWWFLRVPFSKEWTNLDLGTIERNCRLGLMYDAGGTRIHTGQQITALLQFVLFNAGQVGDPPPFQIGPLSTPPGYSMPWASQNIQVNTVAPTMDANGVSCLQALHKIIAYCPDVVGWFDHTSVPPKLMMKRHGALPVHEFTVGQPPLSAVPQLIACHDLQTSVVVLHFEKPVGGGIKVETRQYPEAANRWAWNRYEETLRLGGSDAQYSVTRVNAKSMEGILEPKWWKEHCPDMNLPHIELGRPRFCEDLPGRFEEDITPAVYALTRELVPGSPVPPPGSGLHAAPQTVRCKILCTTYDGPVGLAGVRMTGKEDIVLTVKLTVTDCLPGETDLTEFQGGIAGEEIPENLAKDMYDSLAMLHWKGNVDTLEREVTGECTLGSIARLGNVEGEAAAARCMVQTVDWDAGDGRISRSCGPPGHLGLGERWGIQRRSRFRMNVSRFEETTKKNSKQTLIGPSAPGVTIGKIVTEKFKEVTKPVPLLLIDPV